MNPIIHIVPRREIKDEESLRRHRSAFATWQLAYDMEAMIPCHVWETTRDATSIGCYRKVPFLKDVIQRGVDRCHSDEDVLLFTNDDVGVHPLLPSECNRHTRLYGAGVIRRVNINTPGGVAMPPITANPITFIANSWPDLGRDAFTFTLGWWKQYGQLIPDFLIGVPCWDICLATLMRVLQGYDLRGYQLKSLYETFDRADLPDGLLIHEVHLSEWQGFEQTKSNQWNLDLFKQFMANFWTTCDLTKVTEKGGWSTQVVVRYAQLFGSQSVEDWLKTIRG